MKKISLLLFLGLCQMCIVFAQTIPNSSFENWEVEFLSGIEQPNDWKTSNFKPFPWTTVEKSTQCISGLYCASLKAVFGTFLVNAKLQITLPSQSLSRYLNFYSKFNVDSVDTIQVEITAFSNAQSHSLKSKTNLHSSNWNSFHVDLNELQSQTFDSINISFYVTGMATMLIDSVFFSNQMSGASFGNLLGDNELAVVTRNNILIYPNPANDIVYINSVSVLNNSKVKLIDLFGNVLLETTLNNEKDSSLRLEQINGGIYLLYIFQNGINDSVKKLKIVK